MELEFLGIKTVDSFTYECYKAFNASKAREFLEQREVTKPLYYIMVYTPEGRFGRDKDGFFNVEGSMGNIPERATVNAPAAKAKRGFWWYATYVLLVLNAAFLPLLMWGGSISGNHLYIPAAVLCLAGLVRLAMLKKDGYLFIAGEIILCEIWSGIDMDLITGAVFCVIVGAVLLAHFLAAKNVK